MNRFSFFFLIFCFCFLFLSPFVLATDLYVPGEYATIQLSIDEAVDGDTIYVAPGTYNKIDYKGKRLHLIAEKSAVTTIIDGKDEGTVVDMSGINSNGASIFGFTITGGKGKLVSSLRKGGGVYAGDSVVVISHNIIRNNSAFYGGGIYIGAEILSTIRNNIIEDNTAENGGGIAFVGNGSGKVISNIIRRNHASSIGTWATGGGVFVDHRSAHFYNNLFESNTAMGGENTIRTFGGAVCSLSGGGIFESCTFVNNSASTGYWVRGGALYFGGVGVYPQIRNCIFWGNSSTISVGYDKDTSSETIFPFIEYTLLPANSISVNPTSSVIWGSGNINSDPLFVSENGNNYYLSQVTAGQAETSPGVDAGSAQAYTLRGPESKDSLSQMYTRTDAVADSGIADIGYHYAADSQITPLTNTMSNILYLLLGG